VPPRAMTFRLVGNAGNQGRAFRRVAVVDPCPPPESTCPQTRSCSIYGSCNALLQALSSAARSTASAAATYLAVPDTTPPLLSILGGGVPFVTPAGQSGVAVLVQVGSQYRDAGGWWFASC
jgi:hypothetical protein